MKLQPDKSSAPLVRAYTQDWLQIDDLRFTQSVLVSSMGPQAPCAWAPCSMEELRDEHLAELTTSGAELVILGTGSRLRLAPPAWRVRFAQARVGLESMDTAAACRTYNILASEGRQVLAALLLERPQAS